MVLWIFGYGSLIWKAGFTYDKRLIGYIKGYKRVFFQGNTDHRGTPEKPGRTVTLEPIAGAITWGVAYCIEGGPWAESIAIQYLEIREKSYDIRSRVHFFTLEGGETPVATDVLIFVASPDKSKNKNYLGPAPLPEIARQITVCAGPSGPNYEYLFEIEAHLIEIGVPDEELFQLAHLVRSLLHQKSVSLQTS